MESFTLEEQPPPGAAQAQMPGPALGAGVVPPQQNQQLPPQMFTTAAQLLDMTDKKLMIALRDGRKLIGVLRSWDQFANLVLQSTVERIFVPPTSSNTSGLFADLQHGIFLVRGENVLLLGEIDLDKDDEDPPGYERADKDVVQQLNKERKAKEKAGEASRIGRLRALGFEGENMGEALM